MTELAKFNQYPEKNTLCDQDLFLIYSESEAVNNTLSADTLAGYIKEKNEAYPSVDNNGILIFGGNANAG